ncbi:MAG: response regulator [Chloroflexi bacterium]|nr:response regulator [Chloroflexota bacterium]
MGGAGCTVLVVEDDQMIVKLVTVMLGQAGYRVREVRERWPEVLHEISAQRPDVLVIEVSVWDAAPFQLLDGLRTDPATRDVPVVALYTSPELSEKELANRGVRAAVAKPFQLHELPARVGQVLSS